MRTKVVRDVGYHDWTAGFKAMSGSAAVLLLSYFMASYPLVVSLAVGLLALCVLGLWLLGSRSACGGR